jgi:outer membrane immunogenic protein
MHPIRRGLGLSLFLAIVAGPVEAADWPQFAHPQVVARDSWNRVYAGVNGGYGLAACRAAIAIGAFAARGDEELRGAIAGGQIGFNWQRERLVLGAEADLQWSDQRNSAVICSAVLCGAAVTMTSRIPWFGTVRGRVGGTMDRVLFYATGGLAYGGVEFDGVWPGVGTAHLSDTWIGWTVGAGAEVPFAGRWTAKAEYLFIDTGTVSNSVAGVLVRASASDHIFRAGINYHF